MLFCVYTYKLHYFINNAVPLTHSLSYYCICCGRRNGDGDADGVGFCSFPENSVCVCLGVFVCVLFIFENYQNRELCHMSFCIYFRMLLGAGHLIDLQ